MSANSTTRDDGRALDPVLMAVLANRFDGIVREMTNTLLRSGRSAIINTARDFSCSIVTADDQLLSAAEGLPIHVIGNQLLTRSMSRIHGASIVEGDAFLHNDPYDGNTHHADHSILVPVFHEGEHLFTAVAKAHQADCGNSRPTTYAGYARDIYEEGAINYPCVRVQRGYEDVDDIIRMSKRRIRVPEQWYGDYLAALGSARIGERRIKEVAEKYGTGLLKQFVAEWFDYSARMTEAEIRKLPSGELRGASRHDAVQSMDDGIPLNVRVAIDGEQGFVDIHLEDNIDCIPAGYNLSEATALASGVTGVLNQFRTKIPYNEGTFRRLRVHLREGSIAGIPTHPASASVATTNVADRIINMTQAAFADLGEGYGLAEGAVGQGPGMAVISGLDDRLGSSPYVNQVYLSSSGGPGSYAADGWAFYGIPVCAGLMYRDSVEIDEQKYPILVKESRILLDSDGAGTHRGAPAGKVVYGPTTREMTVSYAADGVDNPPRGVRGGQSGHAQYIGRISADGTEEALPSSGNVMIAPGEFIVNATNGGGGYGDPADRDPRRVARDVEEGLVSIGRAYEVYRVAGEIAADGGFVIDETRTAELRKVAES